MELTTFLPTCFIICALLSVLAALGFLTMAPGGCFYFFGRHVYFLGWTPLRAPPPQTLLPMPPPGQKGYQSAPFSNRNPFVCILIKTWNWSVAELWGKNWDTNAHAQVTYQAPTTGLHCSTLLQGGYKGVTMVACSPRLWLIGNWWNKLNQHQVETTFETKLNVWAQMGNTKIKLFLRAPEAPSLSTKFEVCDRRFHIASNSSEFHWLTHAGTIL